MSSNKKVDNEENLEDFEAERYFLSSNLALYMEMDTIEETAKNQMIAVNSGELEQEFRNQQHSLNLFYNIVKKPPFRLKGVPIEELINVEQLERYNDLLYDFIYLNNLMENITVPRFGAFSKASSKELKQYFIPKYKKMVNEFLEPTHKSWEDYEFSQRILRQILIREIKKVGFNLEAQKARAYTQTLDIEEIDAIKNMFGRNDGFGIE